MVSKYIYLKYIHNGFQRFLHDSVITERIYKRYCASSLDVENYAEMYGTIDFYLYYMTSRFTIYLIVYIHNFLLISDFSKKYCYNAMLLHHQLLTIYTAEAYFQIDFNCLVFSKCIICLKRYK